MTQSGIKPRPPAPQADALTTVLRGGSQDTTGSTRKKQKAKNGNYPRLVKAFMHIGWNIVWNVYQLEGTSSSASE